MQFRRTQPSLTGENHKKCWQLIPRLRHTSLSSHFCVSKGTWEELTNLCPEEIERDSVSCLEIRYNGTTPRKWVILILTTDGQKGDGIPGRHPFMERLERIIRIAKEDEDELQRRVVDYLERQDFGLQETLKLIFPTGQ